MTNLQDLKRQCKPSRKNLQRRLGLSPVNSVGARWEIKNHRRSETQEQLEDRLARVHASLPERTTWTGASLNLGNDQRVPCQVMLVPNARASLYWVPWVRKWFVGTHPEVESLVKASCADAMEKAGGNEIIPEDEADEDDDIHAYHQLTGHWDWFWSGDGRLIVSELGKMVDNDGPCCVDAANDLILIGTIFRLDANAYETWKELADAINNKRSAMIQPNGVKLNDPLTSDSVQSSGEIAAPSPTGRNESKPQFQFLGNQGNHAMAFPAAKFAFYKNQWGPISPGLSTGWSSGLPSVRTDYPPQTETFWAPAGRVHGSLTVILDYARPTRAETITAIMDRARSEGFRGTYEELMKELNWEAVEFVYAPVMKATEDPTQPKDEKTTNPEPKEPPCQQSPST